MSGLQPGAPWPMRGRCNTRMSRSTATGPQKATMKWSAPLDAKLLACPPEFPQSCDLGGPVVAADGTIFTGGVDGVYAFAPDGTRRWRTPLPRQVYVTPAITAAGLVLAPCLDGKLYALSAGGAIAWTFPADSALVTSPAVGADDTIYVSSLNGTLYALTSTGSVRWSTGDGSLAADVALSLDGSTLYVGGKDRFYSLDAKSGAHGWDFAQSGNAFASVGLDETVYGHGHQGFALSRNGIYLFDTGSNPNDDGQSPTPIPSGGAIFASPGRHLYFAQTKQAEIWTAGTGSAPVQSAILGGDGKVYGSSATGGFFVFDAQGANVDSGGVGGPDSPYLSAFAMGADGTVYVATADGRLAAFRD